MRRPRSRADEGTALIVALWVLLLLSLLVSSFAFDMYIESGITSFYRKRLKAQYMARGGVELARFVLAKSAEGGDLEAEEDFPAVDLAGRIEDAGERLSDGGRATLREEMGAGSVEVVIYPAESRWNVNKISREQWEELLEDGNVPQEQWDELIDAFMDWVDPNDEHLLNGAESDDPYYRDRGYEVKNGPVDTIEEMLLIKGFDEEVLYGTRPGRVSDDREPMSGIARHLTTWSQGGCINPNAASMETLMTLPGLLDTWQVEGIVQYRAGPDGIEGTEDDELFENVDEVLDIGGLPEDVREFLCIQDVQYHRVESTGRVEGSHPVRMGVSCILKREGEDVTVAYWKEGIDE